MTLAIPEYPRCSRTTEKMATLKGRDLLCFSHDWNGDPLSKTHLMRLLSRENRILWVNSIGYRTPAASKADLSRAFRKLAAAVTPICEVEPNIFVMNPLVIPAYGSRCVRAVNRCLLRLQIKRAMRRLRFKRVINWVFNPAASIIAGMLAEEQLIYYCVDEYTAISGTQAQSLLEMEEQLARRADVVVVSSERLYQSKQSLNPNTHLVRHGVDFTHFRRAVDPRLDIPSDLARLPGPIIGYFGLIASDWIDLPLLIHVARSFPDASLVMLGKITMDVSELAKLPNVHLLGRKPYRLLPAYARGFDVALIPFPINEATLNSNPLKAREYLAAGLPVVSTRIPEVEVLNQCLIADDPESFVRQIRLALKSPGPSRQRSETMRSEGWSSRLEVITRILSKAES